MGTQLSVLIFVERNGFHIKCMICYFYSLFSWADLWSSLPMYNHVDIIIDANFRNILSMYGIWMCCSFSARLMHSKTPSILHLLSSEVCDFSALWIPLRIFFLLLPLLYWFFWLKKFNSFDMFSTLFFPLYFFLLSCFEESSELQVKSLWKC